MIPGAVKLNKNTDTFFKIANKSILGRDEDKLIGLIHDGIHIHAQDIFGHTPLHLAMDSGHIKASALLIDKGAKLDARNKDKHTPLREIVTHNKDFHPKNMLEKMLSFVINKIANAHQNRLSILCEALGESDQSLKTPEAIAKMIVKSRTKQRIAKIKIIEDQYRHAQTIQQSLIDRLLGLLDTPHLNNTNEKPYIVQPPAKKASRSISQIVRARPLATQYVSMEPSMAMVIRTSSLRHKQKS
ncbi:ankyrin repeat domain-containing protein [Candidatus Berkiella aquae]|uniref:Ankyrin repeat domain-containing protein n=1 Tax=Candidatus Berkiella aquae TaxID=295108 RepID=A0A0Q9YJY3_9GAMM|nr:ankyrin repeat domain-containing protein [Candidatus Berkiella aquae]MCS5711373.1 ankyrin repeat domain-containing protein [Candidatus Berkiella aquae]